MSISTVELATVFIWTALFACLVYYYFYYERDGTMNVHTSIQGVRVFIYGEAWCTNFQSALVEFKKLGPYYSNVRKITNLVLGQVDCKEQNGVCNMNLIAGYPTIRAETILSNGQILVTVMPNTVDRTEQNMITFVDSCFAPQAINIVKEATTTLSKK